MPERYLRGGGIECGVYMLDDEIEFDFDPFRGCGMFTGTFHKSRDFYTGYSQRGAAILVDSMGETSVEIDEILS